MRRILFALSVPKNTIKDRDTKAVNPAEMGKGPVTVTLEKRGLVIATVYSGSESKR